MSPDTSWFEGGNCTPHCCNFSFMHVWMVTRATINRTGPLASRNPASCTFFSPLPSLELKLLFVQRKTVKQFVSRPTEWLQQQQQCWSGRSGGDIIVCCGPPAAAGFYVICPLSCIVPNFCFCLNRWMEPRCRNTEKKVGKMGWSKLIYCTPHSFVSLFI